MIEPVDLNLLLRAVAIVLGAFVSYWLVRFATAQLARLTALESDIAVKAHRQKRAETLRSILNNVARVALIAMCVFSILGIAGVNIVPVVAGAGVLGVALGFGAQSLIRDYLVGFFILTENQFNIGDQVTIGVFSGIVEALTLRTTTLRDADGGIHIIPNGKVEGVTVHARQWCRATVDITIPYQEEIERAVSVLKGVLDGLAVEYSDAVLEPPGSIEIRDLGARGPSIRITVKTKPGHNLALASEIRKRAKAQFDRTGIHFAAVPDA